MPEISILADVTTGKLIQKYLNRESITVEGPQTGAFDEPVSLFIIDVAGIRERIAEVVSRLNTSTGCTRYIFITSMENPLLNGELGFLRDQWFVSTIAKPIKLSELKTMVDQYSADRPTLRDAN
jgi:hypothetical protein